jgi:uncharacterized Ntn-hydrolase superfamily protein
MTFSIVARCESTGQFGIAVSSSSPAVAARCAFARAGVGAVATQNVTDPTLGDACLNLMSNGLNAQQAIDQIAANTPHIDYRQLTAVDLNGNTACYSGNQTLGTFSSAHASNAACAGNMLASEQVPNAMLDAFGTSSGDLVSRMLEAMQAGEAAGGEAGPVHSAGLLLVDKETWAIANLRVDWNDAGNPIGELVELWDRYQPQMADYVTRAHNPVAAPSYGVPGNE